MIPLLLGLLAAPIAVTQAPPAQSPPDAPPSTVFVPGGRTRIGIDVKDVERMVMNDASTVPFASALIAETPHLDLGVDAFWMMVSEVTQEQYGEFVRATGAAPLEPWCEPAIAAAAREFVLAEATREEEARSKGQPAPEKRTFDRRVWFQANARSAAWAIPDADRARPAVFVDYESARAFARWAGMRLPSEYEYQRAVRGDTSQAYPWGNDWDDDKFAATSLLARKGGTWPVGSFPAGRSKQGVHDLAGNVWEWTSSAYIAYPGYQPKMFDVGYGKQKRTISALADWNADHRVVVGGSFQTGSLMARATVRRGTACDQMAGALGFRCASSLRPGADMARYVIDDDFDVQLRPRVDGAIVEYAPEMALCADAWMSAPPLAREGWTAPERYAVISGHRYVLFTPIAQVPAADPGSFERRSLEEPIPLGLLSSNMALLTPELGPGTYRLSYRAKGVRRLGEGRPNAADHFGEAPLEEVLRLDVKQDHVIVSDLRGNPLIAVPLHVDYGLEREGRVETTEEPVSGDAAEDKPRVRKVRIEASVPSRTTKKHFQFTLDLRVEGGDPRFVWRR